MYVLKNNGDLFRSIKTYLLKSLINRLLAGVDILKRENYEAVIL